MMKYWLQMIKIYKLSQIGKILLIIFSCILYDIFKKYFYLMVLYVKNIWEKLLSTKTSILVKFGKVLWRNKKWWKNDQWSKKFDLCVDIYRNGV